MHLNMPIYLVDDDAAFADSLIYLMESFGYLLRWFDSGQTFLSEVNLCQPGCVILDSRMPELSGQQVLQKLNQVNSPLSVIFLTGHGDVPMAVDALKNGAFDFFQKPIKGKALAYSIEKSLERTKICALHGQQQALINNLTQRELEIFRLITQGKTNKQIAESLFLAIRTIEVHRARLMQKLNVASMAELMSMASLMPNS